MIAKQEDSVGYLKSLEIKHGTGDQSAHGRRGGAAGDRSDGEKEEQINFYFCLI